jgi:hypothetical protein
MNLPFFNKKSLTSGRDYLFTLEIGYEFVRSAIWTVVNDKTQVVSVGKTVSCNPATEDSLLVACDQTLTDSANRLDPTGKIQPDKIILGLPVDWVSQNKIEPEKLHLLRVITQKLSLSAIGFVVTPQALVRYIQHSEGVPPTAILIGLWHNIIEVTLIHLGKIESVQAVHASGKVTADIIEGLSRSKSGDILPSRILIHNAGSDLEDVKQNLLSFSWQAPQHKLSFLHFPKIEILPYDFSVRAISLAGGSEVAQAIGLISPTAQAQLSPEADTAVSLSPRDLGFVAEEDIASSPPNIPAPDVQPGGAAEPEAKPEPRSEPLPAKKPGRLPSRIKLSSFRLPAFHFRLPRFPRSLPVIALVLITVLVVAGVAAAYWFLPKATVTILVTPKSLQHEFNLTADPTVTSPDSSNLILPASTVEVTVPGQKSKPTTGSILVGDKATGEVMVINGTPVPRSFPAGTVITSPSGLKYTFDLGVEVASASGTADPNSYQPGKATAKITAEIIGSDSNLSAGTQFKIGSFSTLDYVARNDTAFTGGSSRQVPAVSKQDLADLKSQLAASLQEEAKNKLLENAAPGHQIINESVKFVTVSERYSHTENEEAGDVGLDLTIKASGLEFATSDLESLIKEQTASLIPSGYEQAGETRQSFTINSVKDKQVELTVGVSSLLLPRLDRDEIISDITGKYPAKARDYLTNIPGVSQINFRFSPPLPSQILTLPHVSGNIDLVIEPGN